MSGKSDDIIIAAKIEGEDASTPRAIIAIDVIKLAVVIIHQRKVVAIREIDAAKFAGVINQETIAAKRGTDMTKLAVMINQSMSVEIISIRA